MTGRSFHLPGKVFLVGAGPGSAGLLTLRAHEALRSADIVFHDDLVSEEVLALIPPSVAVHSVGKRCGNKKVGQGEIEERLVRAARSGQTVVRLKGGDALIFGRAQEEIAALRQAGVRFEIIPGVTTASAAAAAAQISLTGRNGAAKLVFLSNHRAVKRERNWQNTFEDSTLVVYMPGRDLAALEAELLEAGMAAETPFLAISQAALPEAGSPRLLIIGKVIEGGESACPASAREPLESAKNRDKREVILEIHDEARIPLGPSLPGS